MILGFYSKWIGKSACNGFYQYYLDFEMSFKFCYTSFL